MTTVPNNTFTGPNEGILNGYAPLTIIESDSVDADLTKIKSDLDTHLSTLQSIYTKLDTIDSNAEVPQSASEIVSKINISAELIDVNNLATTVAELSDITTYIAAHKVTTTQSDMHGETSIKSTGQTYSETPTSIVTSCQNVLDEINNLRIQIHKIVGKTTWIDTPDSNINTIKTKLDTIETAATADQTASEIRTLVESASNSNVFTDTDHSKLNGIETAATADQTASEIRTLVESASNSNVFTDTDHSKLNGIETGARIDQTASEIRTLVTAASNSNVFTDIDHSKLDTIETAATADQTASEIRALVESASNSNVFTDTDHSKLNGIETEATYNLIPNDFISMTTGSDIFFTNSEYVMHSGINYSDYYKTKEIKIEILPYGSTLRIAFSVYNENDIAGMSGRIYRNGVAVGEVQFKVGTHVETFTETISGWSVGDYIQLYTRQYDYRTCGYFGHFNIVGEKSVEFTSIS